MHWLSWTGLSFIVGGVVSLAMSLAIWDQLTYMEELTGYGGAGWIVVGVILFLFGLTRKKPKTTQ